jgi:branched-chain amino acid transport system ATP-binding protein
VAFARPAADGTTRWSVAEVYATFPALAARARHRGDQLSGGEQQMLAIGRALMTHPRLLILDEATEGLAPLVREEIWRCLALLRSRGQAILVIDKYVRRLLALADSHTLLERGRVVWSGSSRALAADEELWQRTVSV